MKYTEANRESQFPAIANYYWIVSQTCYIICLLIACMCNHVQSTSQTMLLTLKCTRIKILSKSENLAHTSLDIDESVLALMLIDVQKLYQWGAQDEVMHAQLKHLQLPKT